jgi:hypothetical protein
MPTSTINYGLLKDDENEFYNVQRINENLDKIDKALGDKAGVSKVFTVTLASDEWVGSVAPFTQTVTIEGIKQTDIPFVDVVLSNDITTAMAEESAYSNVSKVTTSDGSITVRCNKKKPSINLNLILRVVG